MLLDVTDFGVLADKESVNSVVLGIIVAAVVDTAARDDCHIGALADKEVVEHFLLESAL